MEESQEANPVLRALSALGGLIILLASGLFTLGSSLAAPIGFWLASRRARGRGRPLTRLASWLSAVFASIIVFGLGLLLLAAILPSDAWEEMKKSATEARAAQDTVSPPAWTKTLPQAAQSDSLVKKVASSPGAFVVMLGIGVFFTCIAFGAIAGSAGWVATVLLRY